MKKQPFAGKPLHHYILKEAQLVDSLDNLMTTVTHPQQLTTLSKEDIRRIAVSNTTTTKQLQATLQLAHLLASTKRQQRFTIRFPRDVVQYCRDTIAINYDREILLIGLNTKNMVTTTKHLTEDTMQSITPYQRVVFRHLIMHKCASGIMVLSHADHRMNPSQEEVSLVKQITEAADIFNIPILDVIHLSETDHISFKEQGLL